MGVSVEVCTDTFWKGLGDLFNLLSDEEESIKAHWYQQHYNQTKQELQSNKEHDPTTLGVFSVSDYLAFLCID